MTLNDTRKVQGRGAYGYIESKWVFNAKKSTSRRRLQRQVYYQVYGDKQSNPTQRPRGFIYRPNGDVDRYGDYKAWAMGQSRRQNYIFRTHISPKGQLLSDQEFVTAIQAASRTVELFRDFRVVIHRDTANTHAHMLFASKRQWRRAELARWKVAVRQELMAIERKKCAELGIPLPGSRAEKVIPTNPEPQDRIAKPRPKRRRRRRRRKQNTSSSMRNQTRLPDKDRDGMALE